MGVYHDVRVAGGHSTSAHVIEVESHLLIAQQLQNLASTKVTLKQSNLSISGGVCTPCHQAVGLLLLDHLPAVVQSSSKVTKLCMGSSSVVKNSDRSLCILADSLRKSHVS